MPANARGTRSDVTYPAYRNKDYAHSAATYVEFVVDGNGQRLLYRAYLGGNTTSDFNLFENTDYVWKINLNNADYAGDPRIQLLDLTPVSSANRQTTSNCFMMKPGTNICFNPYKHEAGSGGWNTTLAPGGTIATGKTITKVEVLWQSKDAGTSGELVMGYVASSDVHTNLVNYTDMDNASDALVHVKVPNTNGGNAVIAAYNGTTIVWSWHLWITDYVPVPIEKSLVNSEETRRTALAAARLNCKEGTVHQYRGAAWTYNTGYFYDKAIMDRNLGALRGTWSTTSSLESARTFGNLYQWGRKDPQPGSADGGSEDVDLMFDGDGVSMQPVVRANSELSLDNMTKHPTYFYIVEGSGSNKLPAGSWGETKTINDPCPEGWQVPDFTTDASKHIWSDFSAWGTNLSKLVNGVWANTGTFDNITLNDFNIMNGMRYKLSDDSEDYAWFPFFRPREHASGLLRDPSRDSYGKPISSKNYLPCYIVFGANQSSGNARYFEMKYAPGKPANVIQGFGFGIRCIQK